MRNNFTDGDLSNRAASRRYYGVSLLLRASLATKDIITKYKYNKHTQEHSLEPITHNQPLNLCLLVHLSLCLLDSPVDKNTCNKSFQANRDFTYFFIGLHSLYVILQKA